MRGFGGWVLFGNRTLLVFAGMSGQCWGLGYSVLVRHLHFGFSCLGCVGVADSNEACVSELSEAVYKGVSAAFGGGDAGWWLSGYPVSLCAEHQRVMEPHST